MCKSIHYGLTDKEFDKFVLKMGEQTITIVMECVGMNQNMGG